MKIGIMQPYFMPYIGYFQLINAVDKYIIYDDVNYIKRGWVNRNNIIVNKEKKMFSIALKEASQNKLFTEIEISDDFMKLNKTLDMSYAKSSYYKETMGLLDQIFSFQNKQLSVFLSNSIELICKYLKIETEILISSSLNKNNDLKGEDKIIDICKALNATTYINAIGGRELYKKEDFKKQGIDLLFLETILTAYPQQSKEFIPGLSIIDVLMNNSPDNVRLFLDDYKLVK